MGIEVPSRNIDRNKDRLQSEYFSQLFPVNFF